MELIDFILSFLQFSLAQLVESVWPLWAPESQSLAVSLTEQKSSCIREDIDIRLFLAAHRAVRISSVFLMF